MFSRNPCFEMEKQHSRSTSITEVPCGRQIPQKLSNSDCVWYERETTLLNEAIDICFCNITWSILTNQVGQCQEIYLSLTICFAHSLAFNSLKYNILQQVLILLLKLYCAKHSHHKGRSLQRTMFMMEYPEQIMVMTQTCFLVHSHSVLTEL